MPDNSEQVKQAKQRFGIIGSAPALTAAVERALRGAPIDLSVLVIGESGTGKEFFPRIIHAYSPRKHAPYIAVNCGALPEGTIDSELFGHEKGAFTGAVESRKGYFEEADGGTIFLDEVAELPAATQARLLRVLETGEYMRVGSSKVRKTNVRIVAATNVDMIRAVAEGRFREDLYYRLSTVQISVPPLRDRGDDIALLARKFASDFASKYRVPPLTFNAGEGEALRALAHYNWPGNVRQLRNVIDQMALFEAGKDINSDIVRQYLPDNATVYTAARRDTSTTSSAGYEREREMLLGMILGLQQRIDELQAAFQKQGIKTGALHHIAEPDNHTPLVDVEEVQHTGETLPAPTHLVPVSLTVAPPTLEDNERELIRMALERNSGRRKVAAKELNISERTLYRKIKEYGLE